MQDQSGVRISLGEIEKKLNLHKTSAITATLCFKPDITWLSPIPYDSQTYF